MVKTAKTIFDNYSKVNACVLQVLKSLTSYGRYMIFSIEYQIFIINITFLNPKTFKILFSRHYPYYPHKFSGFKIRSNCTENIDAIIFEAV